MIKAIKWQTNIDLLKKEKYSEPDQLFKDLPCLILVKGEVSACFDKEILYDHTYGKIIGALLVKK